MRAAIYARKSTKDEREQGEKSVTRQIEHARKYITGKGWSVADQHVFKDDGISGAEFRDRPGLLQMLMAAESKQRAFDVIVVQEQSRLGRNEEETMPILYRLRRAGIAVYCFLNGQQISLDSLPGRLMASIQAHMDEWEREIASQRARDAFVRKATAGHVTGGECYGYTRVRVNSHVEHRINEEEAEIVRNVFRLYAEGHGYDTIAKALNRDPDERYIGLSNAYFGGRRIPSPKAGRRHTGTWAVTALHEMLRRERYIGSLVYGKWRNVVRNGNAEAREPVEPSKWIIVEKPELRIVPQDLWDAVQAKFAGRKSTNVGRPGYAGESRYLLSAIARCGECGASMVVIGGANRYYGCSYHRQRGVTACRNSEVVPVRDLDGALLAAIRDTVMTPKARKQLVSMVWDRVHVPAAKTRDPRAALDGDIRDCQRRLDTLWDELEVGDRDQRAQVRERIAKLEARLRDLKAQRAQAEAVAAAAVNQIALRRTVERYVAEWSERLSKDVAAARLALRALLDDGKLMARPVERPDGSRVYAVEGATDIGALLSVSNDGVPTGIRTPVTAVKGRCSQIS